MVAISKKSTLHGTAHVPGGKAHTIRAVLLAAMAEGRSVIHNPLPSLDCKTALAAARGFGAVTSECPGGWAVEGRGNKLLLPENYIDCENSGSVAYFAAPMAALIEGYTFITGDAQIRRRPIIGTLDAIKELGGEAFCTRPGSSSCPAVVRGPMRGGQAHFDGMLSQLVSGIMMSAPLLAGDTEVFIKTPHETPYLQLTLDWMTKYGITLENNNEYDYFKISGGQAYTACESVVCSDWSSVVFPLVAGVICESDMVIDAINFNDSQGDKILVEHLIAMGADIAKDYENQRLIVKGGKPLHSGLTISLKNIPDSLPILAVAAAYAEGDTHFTGLTHVRLKETDRVAVMEEELTKMGAHIESGTDEMIIHGGTPLKGAFVDSHDDHRIAMAMTICGMAAEGETQVKNAECAAVSFPDFFKVMSEIGGNITNI